MNEKAKFAACVVAGVASMTGLWVAAALPLSGPHSVWFALSSLSLAVLLHTFELSRRNLQRTAGVVLLLAGLVAVWSQVQGNPFNDRLIRGLLNRHGEYGIYCLGAGLLILAGGIDLSIGSVIVLSTVMFGKLMILGVPPVVAVGVVLAGGVLIGVLHGLLVTQLGLQAFLVTLCGMFVYRGLARTLQPGQIGQVSVREALGEGGASFNAAFLDLRYWLTGQPPVADNTPIFPAQLVVFLTLAAIAAVFLHRSVFGRYWYAIGNNEQAAKYAGITVWRHKVTVFAACSGLAALGGVVLFLRAGSITPSQEGSAYELYAITAAVLGGVSLRGGEGTAVGLVLGAMVLPLINQVIKDADLPDATEPLLIGLILLAGTITDETIRRRGRGRV